LLEAANASADPSSTLQMLMDAAEAGVLSGQLAKVVELGEQADSLPVTIPTTNGSTHAANNLPAVPERRNEQRLRTFQVTSRCPALPGPGVGPVEQCLATMTTIPAPAPDGISEIVGQIARSLIASAGPPGAIG
jgi:hypothetical protein